MVARSRRWKLRGPQSPATLRGADGGGSIAGSVIGGLLVDVIAEDVIAPALGAALSVSAVKVWRHDDGSTPRSRTRIN